MGEALAPAVQQGREPWAALLRQLLCGLDAKPPLVPNHGPAAPPPRKALLSDVDFSAWPLDEPAVLHSLVGWLRPAGQSLRMVGVDFEAVARRHPRFTRWRRDWAHRVEVRRPVDGLLAPGQRLLLAGPLAVQWLEAPGERLRVVTDVVHVAALREEGADFLQRCEPAWSVNTLGL